MSSISPGPRVATGISVCSPLPSAFFCMCQDFLGQAQVRLRPGGCDVVHEHRRSVTGRLRQPDVAGDDGLEHRIRKMLTYLLGYLPVEVVPPVEQGHEDAFDDQSLIQAPTHPLARPPQPPRSLE